MNKLIERRAIIWDRSGGICHYCKIEMHPIRDFTVDHVIPRSKGGTDDLSNLVAACWDCNYKKRDRTETPMRRISSLPRYVTAPPPAPTINQNGPVPRPPEPMSLSDISGYLRVPLKRVERWVTSGELGVIDSIDYLVSDEHLDRFLQGRYGAIKRAPADARDGRGGNDGRTPS